MTSRSGQRPAEPYRMVDEIFERFRLAHGVPGIAYGIVVDGVLAHASGAGVRDLTTHDRPGPDTVFRHRVHDEKCDRLLRAAPARRGRR